MEKETADTYTFKFEVPKNIEWTPGAYAHFLSSDLQNGEKVNKKSLRELSIMSHPDEKFIGFTTRIRQNPSEFKQAILDLKIGDKIRIFKIGNHFKKQNTDKPIVFISMGVGIATFRPLILNHLADSSCSSLITSINVDRTGDFVYQQEFEKQSSDQLRNRFVTNRNDLYKAINQCIDSCENIYYIVGSKEFNKSVNEYLLLYNIPKKAIVLDQ